MTAVSFQIPTISFFLGVQVMYYFANIDGTDSGTDSGGSLPQYFGFPSDLYHFGHFALKFKTR